MVILTNDLHLLSDVAVFTVFPFLLWAIRWEVIPRRRYDFFRIKILDALVSIKLIWLLFVILVYDVILKLIINIGQVDGFLLLLITACCLVINSWPPRYKSCSIQTRIVTLKIHHDHDHQGHHHGLHYHNHTEPLVVKKKHNINVQGIYLHVLKDSIQSICVMIGGPSYSRSQVFSIIVLGTTIKMIRDILEVLMESSPKEINTAKLQTG
ncbi:hypothetical protein V2J09_001633 [Rumex salicifolius]